jgi:hypothetical protein
MGALAGWLTQSLHKIGMKTGVPIGDNVDHDQTYLVTQQRIAFRHERFAVFRPILVGRADEFDRSGKNQLAQVVIHLHFHYVRRE